MVIVAHMIDHSYGNLPMAVADLGEVPRGLGPPLIFRPSWGPKGAEKNLFGDRPPLSQGLDDRAPPYLKVWMRHCMGHFSWTDSFHKQHNSGVIWSTLWCWIRKQIIIYREKRGSRVHQNRPTSQITQPITHKKTKNKWHAFTVKVEGTITAEEALRYTYKLIFKQDLKEIREWGLFTERKGLMQMGRYIFQNLWTLGSPFSFYRTYFWRNN